MADRPAVISPNWWIGAVVLVAIVVGILAVAGIDRSGEDGNRLGEAFEYSIEQYKTIDPALIGYRQTAAFPTQMQKSRALAVGPEDRIFVAGDRAIHVFTPDGSLESKIPLGAAPQCLAVAGPEHDPPGQIYVGMDRHVEVLDPRGEPVDTWEALGGPALLTAVAVAPEDVFVADAGNRVVVRYNTSGEVIGRIGAADGSGSGPRFVIPSPFFDAAIDHDGLLRVVNPGALRIEAFTFAGNLERFWGEAAADVDGFFGCCNPAHFAILSDGRFVTAEKGLLRVKVYSPDGQFECAVADHAQLDSPGAAGNEGRFDNEHKAVDVAVDGRDRVLVLDLTASTVRIFEPAPPVDVVSGAEM